MGQTDMDYVSFGRGRKNLIMIPGLGDGLKTVRGSAAALAVMYRLFAKDYTVYVFSRKNYLPEEYSTREMAEDLAQAMGLLGIPSAAVLGISQGGMIAQHLALTHPRLVEKLVLAVTLCRPNRALQGAVTGWIGLAKSGDYRGLLIDTAERSYSERYLKKYRPLYPLLGKIGRPKRFDRFLIQAAACISHNTYDALESISCPTLVIGGDSDAVVGPAAAKELADKIPGSRLFLYQGLGHGAYEEAKDFNRRVLTFLTE